LLYATPLSGRGRQRFEVRNGVYLYSTVSVLSVCLSVSVCL